VLKQLQAFIGTSNDVVILTASGTGAMEAAVSNLCNPGDTVLVLSAGKFGERWVSLAKTYGCKVRVVRLLTADDLDGGGARAVFRRGARRLCAGYGDLDRRAPLHSGAGRDGARHGCAAGGGRITGLGTTHLEADAVDVIIGGSQKALMIPPGLAYLAASERAWKRMETTSQPRYYFDLRKEHKSNAKGEARTRLRLR